MNQITKNIEHQFAIEDFFKILFDYKWFIIIIISLFLIFSNIYLFFKPEVYNTFGIIEVKTYDKNRGEVNDLLQNAFYTTNKDIGKEIELLRTFDFNKMVINNMNFKTEFFLQDGYRKHEIYGDDVPIEVNITNIINDKILGKIIKLTPQNNGYSLEIEHSIDESFFASLISKELITIKNKKLYNYKEFITNNYFTLSIQQKSKLTKPIYFKIHGNTHSVYDNIIKNKLTITQLNKNTPLINISYEDNIPLRATDYINKLITVFLSEGQKDKKLRSDKILEVVKKQLKETKLKLKTSENSLKNYKINNDIVNPSVQINMIIRELNKIDIKISKNQIKQILVKNMLNVIKNKKHLDSIAPSLTELGDRATLNHLTSLQELEFKESKLNLEYTDEYPELIMIQKQIEKIKQKIFFNVENLRTNIIYNTQSLQNMKKKHEFKILKFPTNEIKLINLKRDYEVNSKMYAYLLKKKSEQEVINVAVMSDYKIVESAYLPTIPIKPKRATIQILSLISGLLMGIIIALIFNALNKKIKSIEDIEKNTPLEIYGMIPFKKQKATKNNTKIEVFNKPQSNFSESFRQLRTDLEFASKNQQSNVILITSIASKEGKSNILANLSAIFQLAGAKSIIIDLNLRQPSLDKYFEIEHNEREGISSYLSGKSAMGNIIFPTAYANLDIIPAGQISTNPSELMFSNKIEIMIQKLKEEYDYIFIDSAPIGSFTDTLKLMKYSDINLIVFKIKQSKKSYIQKLERIITKYNLKNIKLIINTINLKDKPEKYT